MIKVKSELLNYVCDECKLASIACLETKKKDIRLCEKHLKIFISKLYILVKKLAKNE